MSDRARYLVVPAFRSWRLRWVVVDTVHGTEVGVWRSRRGARFDALGRNNWDRRHR